MNTKTKKLPTPGQTKARDDWRKSKREKVLQYIREGQAFSVDYLALCTGYTIQSVTHALQALQRQGLVYRIKRGIYRCPHNA